jgi:hypothetical protein
MMICDQCGAEYEGFTCNFCLFVKPDSLSIVEEPLYVTLDRLRSGVVADLTSAIEAVRSDDYHRASQLVYLANQSLETFQLLVEDYNA